MHQCKPLREKETQKGTMREKYKQILVRGKKPWCVSKASEGKGGRDDTPMQRQIVTW